MHEDTAAAPSEHTTTPSATAPPGVAASSRDATPAPTYHTREHDFATGVYLQVERSLRSRRATEGTFAARVEERLKRRASQLWGRMKHRPSLAVLLAGAIGLALASATGAAELLVAISAAYAAYLVLREGVSPAVAVKETMVRLDELREEP
ncbi:MAG: hypothetical protein KF764_14265 [Labilithrix sp.]|nr:hypothetical protein [Labilithrix sp.]MBX3221334.1 hypothetical protein [Labilithrix sp.]